MQWRTHMWLASVALIVLLMFAGVAVRAENGDLGDDLDFDKEEGPTTEVSVQPGSWGLAITHLRIYLGRGRETKATESLVSGFEPVHKVPGVRQGWKQLAPLVAPSGADGYPPGRDVPAGWRYAPRDDAPIKTLSGEKLVGNSFYVTWGSRAQGAAGTSTGRDVVVGKTDQPYVVEAGVRLLLLSGASQADRARMLERYFRVEHIALDLRPVMQSNTLSDFEAGKLASTARVAVPTDAASQPDVSLRAERHAWGENENRDGWRHSNYTHDHWGVRNEWVPRASGIYELKLTMQVSGRMSQAEEIETKTVSGAIRLAVAPERYEITSVRSERAEKKADTRKEPDKSPKSSGGGGSPR